MATYNPLKKAPNVSNFIANLNAYPVDQDGSPQQQDGYDMDDDLALFADTVFNYEPEVLDQPPLEFDTVQDHLRQENAAVKNISGEDPTMNFANGKFPSSLSQSISHISCCRQHPACYR